MFDPNAGRFNLAEAEAMLGITDDDRNMIQMVISIDLLLAHAGITKDQVQKAYMERIKNDLRDTGNALLDLAGNEDSEA